MSTTRPRRRLRQHELPLRTWGGRRARAGRKPSGARAGVPHRARPEHKERHPVHVTLRVVRRLPSLRQESLFGKIRSALANASGEWFRVLHFSVQTDHIHLVVEARSKTSLSRGMAGLSIRLARAVNRQLQRFGSVLADRYHSRPLTTPREVRHCLVYVLMNFKKHQRSLVGVAGDIDVRSSAFWFDGWRESPKGRDSPSFLWVGEPPVRPPRTWLAQQGWRRHGLIRPSECPTGVQRV
jgi:REP element-mobilizing transposase RayT